MLRLDKFISAKLIPWIFPGLIALILLGLINTFCFSFMKIKSRDMASTLNPGDVVLLNKLSNTFLNGDIIAFYFENKDSLDQKTIFIQRCIAGPGDSLSIEDGIVFVNNKEENANLNLQHNYHIKPKSKADTVFIYNYAINEGGSISNENDFSFSLTRKIAESLRTDSSIALIERNLEKKDFTDEEVFPSNKNYNWNRHFFGPLYIPKKNDVLQLDTNNIHLYKNLISFNEKNKVEIKHDSIFINNTYSTSYTVKYNYCFVMGDNRDNANDSRYIGLVPEKDIIGKISRVVLRK